MVIDASVAVKWFLEEDRSREARRVISEEAVLAPTLILFEVMHAISTAVRQKRARPDILSTAQSQLPTVFDHPASDAALFPAASALERTTKHSIYDCLYLALAEHEGAALVTADEGQYEAARRARIDARLL